MVVEAHGRRLRPFAAAATGGAALAGGVAARRRLAIDNSEVPATDRPVDDPDLEPSVAWVTSPDGARLRVVSAGPDRGPLVVLAHCWTGSILTWSQVTRRLVSSGHRVVRWDQRGHGKSSLGSSGTSVAALGDDLAAVLEWSGARNAVIAGHSMGGMTIQAYLTRHEEQVGATVAGAVLVATHARSRQPLPRGLAAAVVGSDRLEDRMRRRRSGRLSVRRTFGRHARAEHLDATRQNFAATPGSVRAGFLLDMLEMDLRPGLDRVNVPVSILCGPLDTLTPIGGSRELERLIPDARLVEVPDAGHMLVFEAPDLIVEAITGLVPERLSAV